MLAEHCVAVVRAVWRDCEAKDGLKEAGTMEPAGWVWAVLPLLSSSLVSACCSHHHCQPNPTGATTKYLAFSLSCRPRRWLRLCSTPSQTTVTATTNILGGGL